MAGQRIAAAFLRALHRVERVAAVVLFTAMAGLMVADVALREITGVGLGWASRVAIFCFITLSMISIGLASHSAEHLRPRFLDTLLPARWNRPVMRIQETLMCAFCLTMAGVAVGVVAETRALEEVSRVLRLPIWPMQAVIPVAFAIAALRHGLYALYLDLKPPPPNRAETPEESEG